MIEEEVKEEVKVEKKMPCRLYCSFLVNRDYYIQMDYKELVWNLRLLQQPAQPTQR